MANPSDYESSDLVPHSSGSLSEHDDTGLAFGVPIREASGPRPERKGLGKVIAFTVEAVKRTGICLLRFGYGSLEWPIAKVHEIESRIAGRDAEMRRKTERDAYELSILRTKAESDAFDLAQKKLLAERESAMREQAEADIEHHLIELNKLGVTVNLVPKQSGDTEPVRSDPWKIYLEALDLSVRLRANVTKAGLETVGQIAELSENDLIDMGFPATSINELRQWLNGHGLNFKE